MTSEEAIERITTEKSYIEDIPGSDKTVKALEMAIEALKQSEQKKGKWYLRGITQYDVLPYICTVCGKEANYIYDFCPNCGAKMKEE